MAAQELASAFENSKVGQFCKKAADAVSEFYEEHKAVINIVVGVVILAACTAATIATAGSCGFLYAVAAGALKGALIGAVTGAVGGLVTGAVEYYEENGTLDGSGKHLLESTAVGFAGGVAIGALAGGAAGAADEILRYAKNVDSFCFVAGTIILTADGTKPIEHIRIGDKVLSTDPETGQTSEKIVLQTFERETTEFVDVTIDGETYTTTPEHPFYVEGKDFVNASKLEAGDRVVCYDTETDTTKTKEVEEVDIYETDEPVSVYNFEVHENHTYHVGEDGVLVHNACKNPEKANSGGSSSSGGSNSGTRVNHSSRVEGFDDWLNKGNPDNQVYFGMQGGQARYTGITRQSKNARLYQHNRAGKSFDDLEIQHSGLTRNQARAIEQYYIENGPNALNSINSISRSNKYYQDASNWARQYLGR